MALLRELAELTVAGHAAARVNPDLPDPGRSAQIAVVGGLHASLSDHVTERVALRPLGPELLGRDLADVAEELRSQLAVVVVTQLGLRDLDPRKVGLVLEQVLDARLVHRRLDRHRRQRVVRVRAKCPNDLRYRLAEDGPETAKLVQPPFRRELPQRGRPDPDEGSGHVRDERPAVAVDDRAAWGLDAERPHLVVLGVLEVVRAGDHLERPQAEEEDEEDRERKSADDRDPDRHLRSDAVRLLDPWIWRQERRRVLEEAGRAPGAAAGFARQRRSPRPGLVGSAGRAGGRGGRADRRRAD